MNALQEFMAKKKGPYLEYRTKLEEMMCQDTYEFAMDTLIGIYDWIEEHQSISPKQMEAVDNIKSGVENRPYYSSR